MSLKKVIQSTWYRRREKKPKPFETHLSSASSHTLYMLPTSFFSCLWRSSLNAQSSASIEVPTPFDVDTSLIVIVDDSSVESSAELPFSSRFPLELTVPMVVILFTAIVSICLRFSWRVNQLWTDALRRNIDERYVCNWAFSSCKRKKRNKIRIVKLNWMETNLIKMKSNWIRRKCIKLPNDWTIDFRTPFFKSMEIYLYAFKIFNLSLTLEN